MIIGGAMRSEKVWPLIGHLTYQIRDLRSKTYRKVTNVSEGAKTAKTIIIRQRSAKLRAAAIAYYKRLNGGKLLCSVTNWSAPNIPLKGEIIELHHLKALAGHPVKGTTMSMNEAIKMLRPVSPNIHRMLHSKPGGGSYSIKEFVALTANKKRARI